MTLNDIFILALQLIWAFLCITAYRNHKRACVFHEETKVLLNEVRKLNSDIPRLQEIAVDINYPAGWNTNDFPSLRSALIEVTKHYRDARE